MDSVPLTDEDRHVLGLWAADCAERVLPLFEAKAPDDARPRDAIEGVRAYARGDERKGRLRPLAWAALAAVREVDDPVATSAARAAAAAVAVPYIHPIATPHQVKHILGSPLYAAWARGLTGDDPDEEIRWALDHAPVAVRDVTRRFPPGRHGRTPLGTLSRWLDTGLRA